MPLQFLVLLLAFQVEDQDLIAPALAQHFSDYLGESRATIVAADELYAKLVEQGIETLYDDRDVRPGEKFADADLMGIPLRIVVSDKTVEAGKYEVKKRTATDVKMQSLDDILKDLVATE